ncbi:hypothetical protein [Butyrivibrio sp. XPD2002]|uniref:hypothetical protein n=1 Tax=Butyrivibrio sp. XPD2002 TaxID=1280665 RepID=UPI0004234B42|nr:hypothetical protein [Butyrivibrio sp. XPD2002]
MRKFDLLKKVTCTAILAVLTMACLIPGEKASAASSVIMQTKLSTNSATVNWSKVTGAKEYYLGLGETKDEADTAAMEHRVVEGADKINHTFTDLKPGMNYYLTLRYRYTGEDGEAEARAGGAMIKTIPDKVTGVTQAKWYTSKKKVYITWEAQTAGYYKYVFMNKSGKKIKSGEAFTNSYDRTIDNDKCYSFKVKTVAIINGKTYEGAWSDRIYLFAQPMIKSYNYGNDFDLKIEGGKLKLNWDKVKYANGGYRIYVSKSRDKGYVQVARAGKNKSGAVVKKFKGSSYKKNGTYYVYVQGIRKSGGRTGTSGIGYVWSYKKGTVRRTYYHGKY